MHFYLYVEDAGINPEDVINEIGRNKSQFFARFIVIHQFRVNAEGGASLVFGLFYAIGTHRVFFIIGVVDLFQGTLPVIERNAGNAEVNTAGLLACSRR